MCLLLFCLLAQWSVYLKKRYKDTALVFLEIFGQFVEQIAFLFFFLGGGQFEE